MARPGISFDDVREVALQLLGQGVHPSIQKVREVLGTGSNSTIAEHLKNWHRELNDAPKTVLPPSVPETVGAAFAQFWRVAAEQAEANFQTQREQANQDILLAEQVRDEAMEKMEHAHSEVKALQRQMEQLEARYKAQEKELLREEERRLQAERTIATAEQRRLEALRAMEDNRMETETRIAQITDSFQQFRDNAERQLLSAGKQLTFERERNQDNEAKLMQIIDQNRTDFDKERKKSKALELDLRTQLEGVRKNSIDSRMAVASLEERARSLYEELSYNREAQEAHQAKYLEAIRAIEVYRVDQETAENRQRMLREQLQLLRKKLNICKKLPFPAPA